MKSAQPRPEDESLKRCVAAELERSGFQIVPQAEADFILFCTVEDDWHNHKHLTYSPPPFQPAHAPLIVQPGGAVYIGPGHRTR